MAHRHACSDFAYPLRRVTTDVVLFVMTIIILVYYTTLLSSEQLKMYRSMNFLYFMLRVDFGENV